MGSSFCVTSTCYTIDVRGARNGISVRTCSAAALFSLMDAGDEMSIRKDLLLRNIRSTPPSETSRHFLAYSLQS